MAGTETAIQKVSAEQLNGLGTEALAICNSDPNFETLDGAQRLVARLSFQPQSDVGLIIRLERLYGDSVAIDELVLIDRGLGLYSKSHHFLTNTGIFRRPRYRYVDTDHSFVRINADGRERPALAGDDWGQVEQLGMPLSPRGIWRYIKARKELKVWEDELVEGDLSLQGYHRLSYLIGEYHTSKLTMVGDESVL